MRSVLVYLYLSILCKIFSTAGNNQSSLIFMVHNLAYKVHVRELKIRTVATILCGSTQLTPRPRSTRTKITNSVQFLTC